MQSLNVERSALSTQVVVGVPVIIQKYSKGFN